jgi:hypothetical protein
MNSVPPGPAFRSLTKDLFFLVLLGNPEEAAEGLIAQAPLL